MRRRIINQVYQFAVYKEQFAVYRLPFAVMATIKTFEDIMAWQKARDLCNVLGRCIDAGKFKNNRSLIDQMQRSSGSIMDNIAEGFERGGNREFLQFLYIAKGSCGELRSQLYRALDREYLNQTDFEAMSISSKEIISLLQKLINYLEKTSIKGMKYKTRQETSTTDKL